MSEWRIEFDASVYGGGAVLYAGSVASEFFFLAWPNEVYSLRLRPGDSKHQSAWEFLTLFLALVLWGDDFVHEALLILGDNTAALQDAIGPKGKNAMLWIARELSC